jgi:hypothetical protein
MPPERVGVSRPPRELSDRWGARREARDVTARARLDRRGGRPRGAEALVPLFQSSPVPPPGKCPGGGRHVSRGPPPCPGIPVAGT